MLGNIPEFTTAGCIDRTIFYCLVWVVSCSNTEPARVDHYWTFRGAVENFVYTSYLVYMNFCLVIHSGENLW